MDKDVNILFLDKGGDEEETFTSTLLDIYNSCISYVDEEYKALDIFLSKQKDFHLVIAKYTKKNELYSGFIKKILNIQPNTKIILINDFKNKKSIFKIIKLGVNRVLPYHDNTEDLKTNIQVSIEYIEQIIRLNKLNKDAQNSDKLVNEYKKAVDASTIFSISDLKGRILYANRQFLKVSGYTLEELVGRPHSIVRHPDMEKSAFKNLWDTIQDKKVWRGIVKNKRKNGEAYYVDATIVPIMDENSNVVEYAGIRYDITELVLKSDELSELKDKQRAKDVEKALSIKVQSILESIPFASAFIEEDSSKIIYYNDEFKYLLQKQPCSNNEECTLKDIFVHDESYMSIDTSLSFYDSYELYEEDERVVGIKLEDDVCEFKIGAIQKEDGIIISLVERR
jgi:PAS domain S-box-containing protein